MISLYTATHKKKSVRRLSIESDETHETIAECFTNMETHVLQCDPSGQRHGGGWDACRSVMRSRDLFDCERKWLADWLKSLDEFTKSTLLPLTEEA